MACRRAFMAALAVAASAGLLVACGSGSSAGEGARTITDGRGRAVEVPAAPRRVVALSEPTLDGMLAIGLRPIATTGGRGQSGTAAYLGTRADGIPSVGALGRPSIERVAELRPDLILVDGTSIQDGAVIDKLRRIAPTVYVSRTGEDWRRAFDTLADVLGERQRGDEVLARYDDRVAAIRERLGANAHATVSIVRWGGIGLPAVLMREIAASRILHDLGLRRPPFQDRKGPGHSVPVSLENLDAIDADWMFLGALGTGATGGVSEVPADVAAARDALRLARQTPGFSELRSVRAGHVVAVDGSAWTSAGGVLAAGVVLDDVERTLASGRSS